MGVWLIFEKRGAKIDKKMCKKQQRLTYIK
jgi:hypothetical protein